MEKKLHFTIIGSGAGGQTMGAYLAQKGYPVRMFDINKELIAKLKTLDELQAIGCFEAHGKPDVITDDIAEAADALEASLVAYHKIGDVTEAACFIRDEVLPKMDALRAPADEAERFTAAEYWPFPTYGDLLFGVK